MPKTIVQVSDTHLCKVFPYFADNWQHFAAEMEALKPDHLIHTGDISLSGTMDDQAMRHIRNEIDRLPVPCFAIPGNHDIGTTGSPLKPISEETVAHWQTHFGEDRFVFDIERWRLIGLNTKSLVAAFHRKNCNGRIWRSLVRMQATGRLAFFSTDRYS